MTDITVSQHGKDLMQERRKHDSEKRTGKTPRQSRRFTSSRLLYQSIYLTTVYILSLPSVPQAILGPSRQQQYLSFGLYPKGSWKRLLKRRGNKKYEEKRETGLKVCGTYLLRINIFYESKTKQNCTS